MCLYIEFVSIMFFYICKNFIALQKQKSCNLVLVVSRSQQRTSSPLCDVSASILGLVLRDGDTAVGMSSLGMLLQRNVCQSIINCKIKTFTDDGGKNVVCIWAYAYILDSCLACSYNDTINKRIFSSLIKSYILKPIVYSIFDI